MASATSQFLRTANTSGQSVGLSAPSEIDVLGQLTLEAPRDLPSLAASMNTNPSLLTPLVEKLAQQGFVETADEGLKLSEAGARALRYTKSVKY
jgi:DNA-binding IclR family transcriptional regulator